MKYYITQAGVNFLNEYMSVKDTAEKLGSWYASHDPKAKPGQEGYMRGRNVPPTDPKHPGSKYDPTKHKAPVKGKPLRYMKPQHRDYAANRVNTTIGRLASRQTDKEEEELGTAGNIHKRDKDKKARKATHTKEGEDTLKKHGVPNPTVPEMVAKWVKGNNPHSKENPEGYIRSDNR